MRTAHILALSLLPACGPVVPPLESASTTDASTTTGASTSTADPSAPTSTPTTTAADASTAPTDTTAVTTAQNFTIKLDAGDTPIQCDPWTQDCPPGQKCAPWAEGGGGAWNATKCVDITGDGAPGEPCTTTGGGVSGMDDCALGSLCWNIDRDGHGLCIALCSGGPENPLCPEKSTCAFTGGGALYMCIPTCDPLLQDCPGDDLCIPNGDSFVCTLDASGDAGQTNDPCEFGNSCDKGLVCLNTAAASSACQQGPSGCCQPFCKFPNAPCPNPDQQCKQRFDPMMPIPPEYKDVGVCSIPQ